ncbi:MAG: TRAP transporter small permease [Armatimonadota bacterium]|nr:TRAP transporter small permease [Armatimonadota bacterium]MDR7449630.1 TRAP transporter small permease [Armatimonadota bacterium]MDR7458438.1 TRAP transporter small permease [Armatimonadota bacterium]MDR7478760.1 TRAP transporter small permease [Armatimonadota bacterium]MDR7488218.1 TRAP transporter small permease [Armatimonadota bacterium]
MSGGEFLYRSASSLGAVLLFAIFLVILAQVAFRYVLARPLVWTEEAARYLYIWTCYLGAAMAFRRGTHVRIGAMVDRVPPAVRLWVHRLGLLGTAGFLGVLAVQGAKLVWLSRSTLAITFPLPWSVIYAAAVLSGSLMLLYTWEALWEHFREARER